MASPVTAKLSACRTGSGVQTLLSWAMLLALPQYRKVRHEILCASRPLCVDLRLDRCSKRLVRRGEGLGPSGRLERRRDLQGHDLADRCPGSEFNGHAHSARDGAEL